MSVRHPLLLLALAASLHGAANHGFSLSGWGFDRPLPVTFPGAIHPKILLGGPTAAGPLLLVGAGGTLYAVDPRRSGASFPAPKPVAAIDPEVLPSAAFGPGGCAVALLGPSGWQLYLVSPGQAPERIASIPTAFRFGVTVSWAGDDIWVASALQGNERFNSKLTRFTRQGGAWSSVDVALPGPTDEKGFFFHTVRQTRKGTSVYFVSRASSAQDASLRDSLCVLPMDAGGQVRSDAMFKMPTSGLVYHQPSLLKLPRVDLLLYSSKKVANYGLQLFAVDEGVELAPGASLMNLVDPQAVVRGNRMEIFALATKGGESRIVRLEMDADRLFLPGYLDQIRPVPATRADLPIRALAVSPLSDETWNLYYTTGVDGQIHVAGPDRETDPPELELIFRKDPVRKISWPDMTWAAPEEPSGLAGYAYLLDRTPDSTPRLMNLAPTERLVTASGLPPGNYWFHLVAIDAFRNVSPVVHRKFEVADLSPPVVLSRQVVPSARAVPPDPSPALSSMGSPNAALAPRRVTSAGSTPTLGSRPSTGALLDPRRNPTNGNGLADPGATLADQNKEEEARMNGIQGRINYYRYIAQAEAELNAGNLKLCRDVCNHALVIRPDGFEVGVLLSALADRETNIFRGRLPVTVSILGLILCLFSFIYYVRVLTR